MSTESNFHIQHICFSYVCIILIQTMQTNEKNNNSTMVGLHLHDKYKFMCKSNKMD